MKFIRRSFISMLRVRLNNKVRAESVGFIGTSFLTIISEECFKFSMRRRAVNSFLRAVGA